MDDDMALATTAISLPNDVVFDILSRIPARSLRRFRRVSREWRALMSDPAFLAAHMSRRPDMLLVDTGNFGGGYGKPDLRLRDLSGNVVKVIKGVGGSDILPRTSIDGLVCVLDGPSKGVDVVDVATGEVLPTIQGLEVTKKMHDFVPWEYETFGIGRTASSGVYKVVWLVQGDTCQVLTLGSDTRRRTKTHSTTKYFLNRYSSPVTIDGVMYFLTEGISGTLLCFDLEYEEWKDDPVEGPSVVIIGAKMGSAISVYITELNGFLSLVQEERNDMDIFGHSQDLSTNIWIMDDSRKSNWSKVCIIPMGTFGCRYMPVRVMHGGEKLFVKFVSRYTPASSSFGLYDLHRKTCTNILSDDPPGKVVLCNMYLEHPVSVNN